MKKFFTQAPRALMCALGLSALMSLSGCFTFSNFQTAKTVGKDNSEMGVSLNYFGVSDGGFIGIPSIEVGGKYGITEKSDIGLRLSTFGSAIAEYKYQFVGNQDSKFAMATGLSAGGSFLTVSFDEGESFGFYQLEVPLHMSFHPTSKFAIYFTPRYIGFGSYGGGENGYSNLIAFSPGIEIGNRVKFGLNVNFITALNDFTLGDGLMLQAGLGIKFRI